jgi:hypothetical protein
VAARSKAGRRTPAVKGQTGDLDAYSIEEFCRRHSISVQVFYKYPDLMPVSFNAGARRLISREAAARWRAEREAANAVTAQASASGADH